MKTKLLLISNYSLILVVSAVWSLLPFRTVWYIDISSQNSERIKHKMVLWFLTKVTLVNGESVLRHPQPNRGVAKVTTIRLAGWSRLDKYGLKWCCWVRAQFIAIYHMTLQWQQQNVNQISWSKQTPDTSPSRSSYGVSIMRILKKMDRVIAAPYYIYMRINNTNSLSCINHNNGQAHDVVGFVSESYNTIVSFLYDAFVS